MRGRNSERAVGRDKSFKFGGRGNHCGGLGRTPELTYFPLPARQASLQRSVSWALIEDGFPALPDRASLASALIGQEVLGKALGPRVGQSVRQAFISVRKDVAVPSVPANRAREPAGFAYDPSGLAKHTSGHHKTRGKREQCSITIRLRR
jgi:hypothetical protein